MLQTHVFRRGGTYYHRVRVPKDLRDSFGRAELQRSLRTCDHDTARLRGASFTHAIIALFGIVRRNMATLTPEEIEDLTKDFYARLISDDAHQRRSPDRALDWRKDERALFHLEEMADHGKTPEDVVTAGRFSVAEMVKDDEDLLDLDHWENVAKNREYEEGNSLVPWLLEGTKIKLDPNSDEFRQLRANAVRAFIEAKKVAVARSGGLVSAGSSDPLFLGVTEAYRASFDPRGQTKFSDLADKFMLERDTKNPAYRQDYRGTINLFTAYFDPSRAVGTFKREDIVDFKDALRQTPAGYRKRYPGLSMTEAITRNQKNRHPVLSARTINSGHLSRLGAIFSWAANNGYIATDITKGIKVDGPKSKLKQDARHPFKLDCLSTLFSGPVYRGCVSDSRAHEPGKHLISDHRYWLPLLALFTGGRLRELSQLAVGDVRQEQNRHFLAIEGDADDEDGLGKRNKTDSSRRNIPLHPDLIRLGFLDYVERQRRSKKERVFPKCKEDKRGSFSNFTKWFGRHLGKLGIKTDKTSFHSFRHNFEDMLRRHVPDEELRRALAGRAFNHSAAVYGDGFSIERLAAEIDKIQYTGLDLSHLARRRGNQ